MRSAPLARVAVFSVPRTPKHLPQRRYAEAFNTLAVPGSITEAKGRLRYAWQGNAVWLTKLLNLHA